MSYSDTQIATARESFKFWKVAGLPRVSCLAAVGDENGESSFVFDVVGDHGEADGSFQIHADRRAEIKSGCGIDMHTASHLDQLKGVQWEMKYGWYKTVWPLLLAATTIDEAVTIFVEKFEQSAAQASDIAKRTAFANYWATVFPDDAVASPKPTPAAVAIAPAPPLALPALKWVASPNYSIRGAKVDLIVLHDCEGSYAGAVNWFANRKSNVSAHLVLKEDGSEATQMVAFADKAWHACNFNSRSIGVEMGGFEERGFADAEWRRAAVVVAYLLHRFGIPAQFAAAGAGPGFCRHLDLGKAGGGHSDPTRDDAVWKKFIAYVVAAHSAGGFPLNWGR